MAENEEKGFTIRDRRTAASEATAEQKGESLKQEQNSSARQQPSGAARTEKQQETGPLSELDFTSFVISLATTAQVSLGVMPNPQTNLVAESLPAAKQMIDILAMLQEKTTGNLNDQEQALIENVLYTLRMQYVKVLEGKAKTGAQ